MQNLQNVPPLVELTTAMDDEDLISDTSAELAPGRAATIWVSRITGAVGVLFLILALIFWQARPGHYRLVLACLIVALFASILHAYTFDNGTEV